MSLSPPPWPPVPASRPPLRPSAGARQTRATAPTVLLFPRTRTDAHLTQAALARLVTAPSQVRVFTVSRATGGPHPAHVIVDRRGQLSRLFGRAGFCVIR